MCTKRWHHLGCGYVCFQIIYANVSTKNKSPVSLEGISAPFKGDLHLQCEMDRDNVSKTIHVTSLLKQDHMRHVSHFLIM